jgi:hypothetical protein
VSETQADRMHRLSCNLGKASRLMSSWAERIDREGQLMHAGQEQTTEPLPDDDCRVRVLLQMADDVEIVGGHADEQHMPGSGASCRARAHNLREAARYIRELEARPSGAIDYERVRELLPELADYADHDIEGVPTILRYVAAVHPTHLQDCGWVGMCSVRGYVQWENGACWLTSKGINAMSIFDACRVEHDPDPAIPEGLSDGALGALLMVAQKPRGLQSELALELGALVCGTLVDSGTASYYEWAPNHTGRALAAKLAANMRCKVVEPEPEEQWSEPAGKMDVEECAALCWTLGDMLEMTAHMGGKWTWKLSHGDGRAAHGNSSCSACECAQDALRDASRNASRYDAATDRVRLDGLEVV